MQTERYRYIRYGDSSKELYDYQNDLNEWTNLADKPEYTDIKAALASHIPKGSLTGGTTKRLPNK